MKFLKNIIMNKIFLFLLSITFVVLLSSCQKENELTCFECTKYSSQFGINLVEITCNESEKQDYESNGYNCSKN